MSSTAGLVVALDALARDEVSSLSTVDLRAELLGLLAASNRLHAELLRRVDVFDARGASVDDAARSTVSWLRAFGRMSGHTASSRVAQARLLRDLPVLAAMAAEGQVSADHLDRVRRLSQRVGVEVVACVEPILAQAATELDPTDLGRVCDRVRAHVDPDGAEPDAGEDFARRGLTFSAFDGMVLVRGQLDPEGGAAVMAAIDAMSAPPAQGDPRTPAQRRADAMVELARQALREGRLPTVGGVRPQIGILLGPEALRRGTAPGDAPPCSQGPLGEPWGLPTDEIPAGAVPAGQLPARSGLAGRIPGGAMETGSTTGHRPVWSPHLDAPMPDFLVPKPGDRAVLDWVGEIPDKVAQRVACDADVWRILLDPASGRPLDVGRAYRLVPHWIRKALHARDRGCRFPGCHAPPAWCDAHHILAWINGGHTNIGNMILVCRYHHGLLHEGGWQLRYDAQYNTVTVRRPDGRPYEITELSTVDRVA